MSTAARAGQWSGIVTKVGAAADLRTRAFPVEVQVPNPDGRLLPGMIARVSLTRPVAADAMVIPQDWLVTLKDARGVFVTADGETASWRAVELGEVIHDRIVVTDGLAAGDRVIITGHRDLVDGDPILVQREGTCCAAGRPVFGG